ncbi:threonine/serine ThrE exporter family protein [Microbacterium indicum]|uniref:threonine/serine ThrE exporter family protein n=1 Tax=Microbacterium indicum TaxID=358100 RepID=UPI0004241792|nr:threonine/serine exporter family protein [Microbacterium indicum]
MGEDRSTGRMFEGLKRALWSDPARRPMTEAIPIIDDAFAQRILDLAMRIAEALLSVGASAKDTVVAALRVTTAYGLRSVHVDITFNSVTMSDHRDGTGDPITLMRVVRSQAADHAKLQRLQGLVDDIDGGMSLNDATLRFHAIRRMPFLYRTAVTVVAKALLAVAVALMFGGGWVVLGGAFVAGLGVALAQEGLAKARVPAFFSQIAGAVVVTFVGLVFAWLASMDVPGFVGARPSLIVSSGIVLMLAGVAIVSSAQDAIDGFSLTAGGRILDLVVMTIGVVLGIVVGLEVASHLGFSFEVPSEAIPFGSVAGQLAGALIIAVAVALMNGAGIRIILVSAALAGIAWGASYLVSSFGDTPTAAGAFGGALVASLVGSMLAGRLHVPSVAVTTAAIIPMVPGSAVFRGLLGVVESGTDVDHLMVAFDSLFQAAMIGLALAAGATLGVFLGTPMRIRLRGRRVARTAAPRASGAGGTSVIDIIPTRPIPTDADDEAHTLTRPMDTAGEG